MNESFLAAGDATSMAAWLKAFDTFDAMHPATVVPSHGSVGPGALIAADRALMTAIRDRAVALKAQGKSIDETAAAIQTEFTAAHPGWPRANGLTAAARAAYNEARAPMRERAQPSEPRERSEPAKRRASERAGESEGRSPSDKTKRGRSEAEGPVSRLKSSFRRSKTRWKRREAARTAWKSCAICHAAD
jgi:hypothetical protein